MSKSVNMNLNDREFGLIAGLLVVASVLLYLFPNYAVENSSGQIDWVTLPLIVLPLIGASVLLAFASMQPHAHKSKIGQPIKLISLN